MFDAVLFTLFGVVMITALFVFGTVLQSFRPTKNRAADTAKLQTTGTEVPTPLHVQSQPSVEANSQSSGGAAAGGGGEVRNTRATATSNIHVFPRPPTPMHYRPATPIHQRPATPLNEITAPVPPKTYQQLQADLANAVASESENVRPPMAVSPDPAAVAISPINTDGSDHHHHHSFQTIDSEQEKRFAKYDELSAEESVDLIDPTQCTVEVDCSALDPLLALIRKVGDTRPLEYVVVKFDKKQDKQLTPSEKQLRKSFFVKHRLKSSIACRFARMKVTSVDPNYYRLVFHDYTPYVEPNVPKYDAFRHEVAKERSHWETVDVNVHHNTRTINIKQMCVLVPGGKND